MTIIARVYPPWDGTGPRGHGSRGWGIGRVCRSMIVEGTLIVFHAYRILHHLFLILETSYASRSRRIKETVTNA